MVVEEIDAEFCYATYRWSESFRSCMGLRNVHVPIDRYLVTEQNCGYGITRTALSVTVVMNLVARSSQRSS